MAAKPPMVEFKNVSKIYPGGKVAVENINLRIERGEFVCFIGTSGGGKTTTLRMINGMLIPTGGDITVDGKNIHDIDPIELRRSIGYVIQNIGLMPHMTIRDNITLVPKLLKWPKEKRDTRAKELIKMVELPEEFLDRYPSELSGGQQQRIGVIRALAADQQIILMDEPFGALDPLTREALQRLVKRLQQQMGRTIIMVTHDMDEAIRLADRIVIMDQGHIIQNASPDDVLTHPANEFVANLIGPERLRQAKVNHLTAAEIMRPNPIKIHAQQNLGDALNQMHQYHVDSLMVVDDEDHLTGILDLKTLRNQQQPQLIIDDMKHAVPVKIKEDERLQMITEPLLERNWEYVPVVDEQNHLKGIITRSALVDVIYDAVWGTTENPHPAKDQAKDLKEAGEQ
ncbi:ABC transporter ATP-binding protein [Limosilactobacillus mucosae]|uniref:ABC transporter ATP-binding protein n=1 Tax=Limosilactobacillus mucosae TaxID=97478 RepID=UPI000884205F|nr:betaine/proline/choline family ABC transporter ATP-binding protein [Limosilactobacillus mucosae]SDN55833.1 osmoprotectant transport system ATP-binding protein [Limosilactobacillus mucosae]SEL09594.1 osmoprotectant transport system ATP-binding protein [Limosilactobacillus mucosae]SFK23059.1 osmoprotectant transport system ATP-binding protein [Limosilactobacillus mucosae]